MSIAQATTSVNGYLSSTDWNTFNSKQGAIALTTTGSSGASTFVTNTLNIPNYTLAGLGGVPTTRTITINGTSFDLSANRSWTIADTGITSLNGLTGTTQTFATGVSGSDFGITSTGTSHTFNIPNSSPSSRGLLSSTDYSTFNNKENALTFSSPLSRSTNTISIPQATTSVSGFLSSTDWNTFNNKGNGTVTSVGALSLGTTGTDLNTSVVSQTTTPVITLNVPTASATNRGVLSSADWTTFNGKESALTFSSPLSRSTNTISIPVATTSVNGYLSSTDWTTFNAKQVAITGGATTITTSNLTASRALVSDASGKVAVSSATSTQVGYLVGVTSAIQTQLDAKVPKINVFNAQTGTTYTLVLSDASKIIEMQSGSPNTLTIPTNASVAFPIGTEIQVLQFGAGQTTIAVASGVTTQSKLGQLKIANQDTGVTLVKRATDDWYVIGNLTA